MENKSLNSEKDDMGVYGEKGYTCAYRAENDTLVNLTTKARHHPKQVHIVAEHRFEGIGNPWDMSILNVAETADGIKGTVLANYSPASATYPYARII